MNKPAAFILALGIMFVAIPAATAQVQPAQQPTPTAEEQEKQKAELDKKAQEGLPAAGSNDRRSSVAQTH